MTLYEPHDSRLDNTEDRYFLIAIEGSVHVNSQECQAKVRAPGTL